MRSTTSIVALLLISTLITTPAAADVLQVPTPAYPTIQSAIDAAVNGDEIELTTSLYAGPGNQELQFLGKTITLRSASGDPAQCTIDCGGTAISPQRAFLFTSGESGTRVEGITVVGAFTPSGGAIQTATGAEAIVRNCVVSGTNGFGVLCGSGSGVTLENTSITGSTRAGIRSSGVGSVTITGGAITGNGEAGLHVAGARTVSVIGTDIQGNTGDGVRIDGITGASVEVTDALITGNLGSGIRTASGAVSIDVTGTTLTANSSASGGGIFVASGVTATITRTILWGNCATGAGADLFVAPDAASADVSCSVLNPSNTSGDYQQSTPNVNVSPRFCSPASCASAPTTGGAYTVESGSPALAENSPCGQRVGARGFSCPAGCVLSASALDFGEVKVDQSAQQSFTITNQGATQLTGSVSASCAHFSIVSGGGGYSLANGEMHAVTVEYAPTQAGSHACVIQTGGNCANVNAIGTATGTPVCDVTPGALDFGPVIVGGSARRSFTIENTGTGALTGDVVEMCNQYEIVSGGGPFSLAGGESVVVTIDYIPDAAGSHGCTIETGTRCPDVPVTGMAQEPAACSISPASLDFGTVTTGEDEMRTFTIRNDGGGTLNGDVSESCNHYTITGGEGPFALAAGDSVVVTVFFSPTESGTHSCTIETGMLCPDVPATGVGEPPPFCQVSATSLDFGTVTTGGSAARTFTIENTGGGTLTGTVGESCTHFEVTSGDGPYAIAAGESLVVEVTYSPTTAGDHGCNVSTGALCPDVSCSGTAEDPPGCAVIPMDLAFGSVLVGDQVRKTFTIKNTGGGTLVGTFGETCDEYVLVSPASPIYALGPGDSVNVVVEYAPTAGGTHPCTIDTGTECAPVSCTGEGIGPTCVVTPETLDFGTVTTGTSDQKSFTIENTGGGTVSGSVGEDCADFEVMSGSGPFALGAGESVVVTVRFAPIDPGSQACTVTTGAACADVEALGVGDLPPLCEVTPTTLNFGTLITNTFADTTFTIENTGGGTVTGNVSASCAHFNVRQGGGGYSLTTGQTRTVTLRYAPTDPGDHTCFIQTGPDCDVVIAEGTGEPPAQCSVSVSLLDFGTVTVDESAEQAFTITNTGGDVLSGSVGETPPGCDHYAVVQGSGSYNLASGQSKTVRVRFTPRDAGTHVCTIDTGPHCGEVGATGRGVFAPACDVSPASLDFGTVTTGTSAQKTFTIKNTGGGTLTGTVTESCPPDYEILSGGGGYALGANESKVVTVKFAPGSPGTSGCLVQTGNDDCPPVSCTGVGELPPECTLSTTSIDYGTVTIGEFEDRSFAIQNTGGGTLTGNVTLSCDPPYDIRFGEGVFSLGAGETKTITIRFEPTTTGNAGCTVQTGTACANVALSGIGEEPPECTLSATSLNFGTVAVGSSAERSVTLSNTGGGTLEGTVNLSCQHYEIASGGGFYELESGESIQVTIRFVPTSTGTHGCSVAMGSGCPNVACTGEAEPPSECLVSATSLDFGIVTLGERVDRSFTIQNTGGLVLVGQVSESCSHYDIVSGDEPYALATGQKHRVVVRYEPTGAGQHGCTIETGSSCESVECTGVGEALPACSVSVSSLEFGTVEVGDFVTRTFEIRNSGGGQLIGSVSEGCQDYDFISGQGGYALFGGQSRSVTVRFSPSTPGEKVCTIQTGPDCESVAARGIGEDPPACTISTSTLDFGTVGLGTSAEQSFTLTNTGGGTLSGSVFASCTHYAILGGGGSYVLAPGEGVLVRVEFAPSTLGTHVCKIETGADCGDVTASGVGGSVPDCVVSPTLIDFGTLDVGDAATRTFVVRNEGEGTLNDPVGVNASCSQFSILAGGGSYTLASGDSVVVTVRYAPAVTGSHGCTVETGSACPSVTLLGEGRSVPGPIELIVQRIRRSVFQLWSPPIHVDPPPGAETAVMSDLFDDMFNGSMSPDRWLGSTVIGSEQTDDPAFVLGRGYWIQPARAVPANHVVRGELRSRASVELEVGWNIIGTPDLDPIPISSLQVLLADPATDGASAASAVISMSEAYWGGVLGGILFDYVDVTEDLEIDPTWAPTHILEGADLQPWAGRLLYAYQPCQLLFGFEADSPPARQGAGEPEATWAVTLTARGGGVTDTDVTVGVADETAVVWDKFDVPKPPLPAPALSLAIDHRDWADRGDLYRRSLDPGGDGVYDWPLLVTDGPRQVTISWEGVSSVPEGYEAFLVLPDSTGVPMAEIGAYTLTTTGGVAACRVLVTSEGFEGPVLDADPGGLTAVYPMPFSNDAMRIAYRVARDARRARLRVFDVNGRRVRDFGSVPGTVGEWEVRWDGRDQSGKPIGSGLYFIRLELDRRVFTIHQVVVR